MVRDEDYIDFLKLIVSCISHGDYFSAKELSNLELEKMEEKGIHVITFTSSSTVRNFMELIGERRELLEGVTIASIGPITTKTAESLGLKVDITADEYTIDGLVKALVEYFQK